MKLTPLQRWTILGTALALTLAAVKWAASDEEIAPRPAQSSGARAPGDAQADSAEAIPRLDLDRLRRAPHEAPRADPFAQKRWTVAAVPAPRPAPPPPRAPQAPPLPFTYFGKAVEGGKVTVFLTKGENSYVARPGVTLDGSYRVEHVDERKVIFTYLPLGTRQELVLGPAQ